MADSNITKSDIARRIRACNRRVETYSTSNTIKQKYSDGINKALYQLSTCVSPEDLEDDTNNGDVFGDSLANYTAAGFISDDHWSESNDFPYDETIIGGSDSDMFKDTSSSRFYKRSWNVDSNEQDSDTRGSKIKSEPSANIGKSINDNINTGSIDDLLFHEMSFDSEQYNNEPFDSEQFESEYVVDEQYGDDIDFGDDIKFGDEVKFDEELIEDNDPVNDVENQTRNVLDRTLDTITEEDSDDVASCPDSSVFGVPWWKLDTINDATSMSCDSSEYSDPDTTQVCPDATSSMDCMTDKRSDDHLKCTDPVDNSNVDIDNIFDMEQFPGVKTDTTVTSSIDQLIVDCQFINANNPTLDTDSVNLNEQYMDVDKPCDQSSIDSDITIQIEPSGYDITHDLVHKDDTLPSTNFGDRGATKEPLTPVVHSDFGFYDDTISAMDFGDTRVHNGAITDEPLKCDISHSLGDNDSTLPLINFADDAPAMNIEPVKCDIGHDVGLNDATLPSMNFEDLVDYVEIQNEPVTCDIRYGLGCNDNTLPPMDFGDVFSDNGEINAEPIASDISLGLGYDVATLPTIDFDYLSAQDGAEKVEPLNCDYGLGFNDATLPPMNFDDKCELDVEHVVPDVSYVPDCDGQILPPLDFSDVPNEKQTLESYENYTQGSCVKIDPPMKDGVVIRASLIQPSVPTTHHLNSIIPSIKARTLYFEANLSSQRSSGWRSGVDSPVVRPVTVTGQTSSTRRDSQSQPDNHFHNDHDMEVTNKHLDINCGLGTLITGQRNENQGSLLPDQEDCDMENPLSESPCTDAATHSKYRNVDVAARLSQNPTGTKGVVDNREVDIIETPDLTKLEIDNSQSVLPSEIEHTIGQCDTVTTSPLVCQDIDTAPTEERLLTENVQNAGKSILSTGLSCKVHASHKQSNHTVEAKTDNSGNCALNAACNNPLGIHGTSVTAGASPSDGNNARNTITQYTYTIGILSKEALDQAADTGAASSLCSDVSDNGKNTVINTTTRRDIKEKPGVKRHNTDTDLPFVFKIRKNPSTSNSYRFTLPFDAKKSLNVLPSETIVKPELFSDTSDNPSTACEHNETIPGYINKPNHRIYGQGEEDFHVTDINRDTTRYDNINHMHGLDVANILTSPSGAQKDISQAANCVDNNINIGDSGISNIPLTTYVGHNTHESIIGSNMEYNTCSSFEKDDVNIDDNPNVHGECQAIQMETSHNMSQCHIKQDNRNIPTKQDSEQIHYSVRTPSDIDSGNVSLLEDSCSSGTVQKPVDVCTACATSTALARKLSSLDQDSSDRASQSLVSAVASSEATAENPYIAVARASARAVSLATASAANRLTSSGAHAHSDLPDDIHVVISTSCTIRGKNDDIREESDAILGSIGDLTHSNIHQRQSSPKIKVKALTDASTQFTANITPSPINSPPRSPLITRKLKLTIEHPECADGRPREIRSLECDLPISKDDADISFVVSDAVRQIIQPSAIFPGTIPQYNGAHDSAAHDIIGQPITEQVIQASDDDIYGQEYTDINNSGRILLTDTHTGVNDNTCTKQEKGCEYTDADASIAPLPEENVDNVCSEPTPIPVTVIPWDTVTECWEAVRSTSQEHTPQQDNMDNDSNAVRVTPSSSAIYKPTSVLGPGARGSKSIKKSPKLETSASKSKKNTHALQFAKVETLVFERDCDSDVQAVDTRDASAPRYQQEPIIDSAVPIPVRKPRKVKSKKSGKLKGILKNVEPRSNVNGNQLDDNGDIVCSFDHINTQDTDPVFTQAQGAERTIGLHKVDSDGISNIGEPCSVTGERGDGASTGGDTAESADKSILKNQSVKSGQDPKANNSHREKVPYSSVLTTPASDYDVINTTSQSYYKSNISPTRKRIKKSRKRFLGNKTAVTGANESDVSASEPSSVAQKSDLKGLDNSAENKDNHDTSQVSEPRPDQQKVISLVAVDIDITERTKPKPDYDKLKARILNTRPPPPPAPYADSVWNAKQIIAARSRERGMDRSFDPDDPYGGYGELLMSDDAIRKTRSLGALPSHFSTGKTMYVETDLDTGEIRPTAAMHENLDNGEDKAKSMVTLSTQGHQQLYEPHADTMDKPQSMSALHGQGNVQHSPQFPGSNTEIHNQSDNELRVTRSLSKLNIPGWFVTSPRKDQEIVIMKNANPRQQDVLNMVRSHGRVNGRLHPVLTQPLLSQW